jgi:hypothetical protein
MNKLFLLPFLALSCSAIGLTGLKPALAVGAADGSVTAEEAAKTIGNWDETRTDLSYTKDGIQLDQTEMGVPTNHAISILKVPFTDIDEFSISFTMTMDEFVTAGPGGNDVWTGLGIMGVPKFINWQNNSKYGWAKDTPGLFNRFFNIGGDLRYEGSVYEDDYCVDGPTNTAHKEDAWQLYYGSADISALSEITYRFVYESDERNKTPHYNAYLNDILVTPNGECDYIDRSVMLPTNEIYLVIAMNTQKDDLNTLSRVVIHSINGVSYKTQVPNTSSSAPASSSSAPAAGDSSINSSSSGGVETKGGSGCSGSIIGASSAIGAGLLGLITFGLYHRRKHLGK